MFIFLPKKKTGQVRPFTEQAKSFTSESMRIFFFLLLTLLLTTPLKAQELLWENTIGGNGQDWMNHAFQNKSGNYIFSGYSMSDISGDKTEVSRGDSDFWIVETDTQGNILWQKTVGGTSLDHIVKTVQLEDQTYLLAGDTWSGPGGEKTGPAYGIHDLWLVKLDKDQNIEWQQTFGGEEQDFLSDVIATKDGGYLVIAHSTSPVSGNKTTAPFGESDLWMLKLNARGEIEWQKSFGGNGVEAYARILETQQGYIIASGSASGVSGNKTEPSRGLGDYWVFEIDTNGEILWQKTIGGDNGDSFEDFAATPDGGYIMGGDSASRATGEKEVPNQTFNDLWLLKIDAQGSIIWQKTYAGGPSGTNWLSEVLPSSTGGYLIAAMAYPGVGHDKTEPGYEERDFWLLKISEQGEVCWDKTLGGNSLDQPMSGFEDHEGNFVVGGWSDSDASGDKSENAMDRDFWVTKISQPEISYPIANIPEEPIMACDQSGDGFTEFDLSGLHEQILGGQENVEVSYYEEDGSPLPSPLPDTFRNTEKDRQLIHVKLTNTLYRCATTEFDILLQVGCGDEGGGEEEEEEEEKEEIDLSDKFPKFFTPNSDGYHDIWKPNSSVISGITSIYIFDRYGKLLKQLPRNTGWDGTFRGRPMPSDDYWFLAVLDEKEEVKGHFSLIRQD